MGCITLVIGGCDSGLKSSDYRGGFVTQNGDCTPNGDVGIYYQEQELEIGFYCFLKECALMSGTSSQGGFFHIEDKKGYYIQGRVTTIEATGTWYLNIKGQDCSGHWVALPNE